MINADAGPTNEEDGDYTAVAVGSSSSIGGADQQAATIVNANPEAGGGGSGVGFSVSGNADNNALAMSLNDGAGNALAFGSANADGSTPAAGAIANTGNAGPNDCVSDADFGGDGASHCSGNSSAVTFTDPEE